MPHPRRTAAADALLSAFRRPVETESECLVRLFGERDALALESDRLRGEARASADALAQKHATALSLANRCNAQTAAIVRVHDALDTAGAPAGPPEVRIADLATERFKAVSRLDRIVSLLDAAGCGGGRVEDRVSTAIADANTAHKHIGVLNAAVAKAQGERDTQSRAAETERALKDRLIRELAERDEDIAALRREVDELRPLTVAPTGWRRWVPAFLRLGV